MTPEERQAENRRKLREASGGARPARPAPASPFAGITGYGLDAPQAQPWQTPAPAGDPLASLPAPPPRRRLDLMPNDPMAEAPAPFPVVDDAYQRQAQDNIARQSAQRAADDYSPLTPEWGWLDLGAAFASSHGQRIGDEFSANVMGDAGARNRLDVRNRREDRAREQIGVDVLDDTPFLRTIGEAMSAHEAQAGPRSPLDRIGEAGSLIWRGGSDFGRESAYNYALADARAERARIDERFSDYAEADTQARRSAADEAMVTTSGGLEFIPGVGLIDVGASIARAPLRAGFRAAGAETPELLRAPAVEALGAPGALTREARDVRNVALAGGAGGIATDAIDGNMGDDPLASVIGAGAAAALARNLTPGLAARAAASADDPLEGVTAHYRPSDQTEVFIEPDGRVVARYQGGYEASAGAPEEVAAALADGSGREALRMWRGVESALAEDIATNARPQYRWEPGNERLADFYRNAMRSRTPEGYVFAEAPDGTMTLTRADASPSTGDLQPEAVLANRGGDDPLDFPDFGTPSPNAGARAAEQAPDAGRGAGETASMAPDGGAGAGGRALSAEARGPLVRELREHDFPVPDGEISLPTQRVPISDIRTMAPRGDGLDADTLRDYGARETAAPPLLVRRDRNGWHLIDGNHRLEIARRRGQTEIEVQDASSLFAQPPATGDVDPLAGVALPGARDRQPPDIQARGGRGIPGYETRTHSGAGGSIEYEIRPDGWHITRINLEDGAMADGRGAALFDELNAAAQARGQSVMMGQRHARGSAPLDNVNGPSGDRPNMRRTGDEPSAYKAAAWGRILSAMEDIARENGGRLPTLYRDEVAARTGYAPGYIQEAVTDMRQGRYGEAMRSRAGAINEAPPGPTNVNQAAIDRMVGEGLKPPEIFERLNVIREELGLEPTTLASVRVQVSRAQARRRAAQAAQPDPLRTDLTQTVYHATTDQVEGPLRGDGSLGPGAYAMRDPEDAADWFLRDDEGNFLPGASIVPERVPSLDRYVPLSRLENDLFEAVQRRGWDMDDPRVTSELQPALIERYRKQGFVGIHDPDYAGGTGQIVTWDASNRRAPWARMSERNKGSSDPLAALPFAIAGGGATALALSPEAEASDGGDGSSDWAVPALGGVATAAAIYALTRGRGRPARVTREAEIADELGEAIGPRPRVSNSEDVGQGWRMLTFPDDSVGLENARGEFVTFKSRDDAMRYLAGETGAADQEIARLSARVNDAGSPFDDWIGADGAVMDAGPSRREMLPDLIRRQRTIDGSIDPERLTPNTATMDEIIEVGRDPEMSRALPQVFDDMLGHFAVGKGAENAPLLNIALPVGAGLGALALADNADAQGSEINPGDLTGAEVLPDTRETTEMEDGTLRHSVVVLLPDGREVRRVMDQDPRTMAFSAPRFYAIELEPQSSPRTTTPYLEPGGSLNPDRIDQSAGAPRETTRRYPPPEPERDGGEEMLRIPLSVLAGLGARRLVGRGGGRLTQDVATGLGAVAGDYAMGGDPLEGLAVGGAAALGARGIDEFGPDFLRQTDDAILGRNRDFRARRDLFAYDLSNEAPRVRGTSVEADPLDHYRYVIADDGRLVAIDEGLEQGLSRDLAPVAPSPRQQFLDQTPTEQLRWMNEVEPPARAVEDSRADWNEVTRVAPWESVDADPARVARGRELQAGSRAGALAPPSAPMLPPPSASPIDGLPPMNRARKRPIAEDTPANVVRRARTRPGRETFGGFIDEAARQGITIARGRNQTETARNIIKAARENPSLNALAQKWGLGVLLSLGAVGAEVANDPLFAVN